MLEFGAANSCFHGNARRSAVVAEGKLVQQKLTGVVPSYRLKAADRGRIDRAVRRHRVLRER
jgi:hypothetical protein